MHFGLLLSKSRYKSFFFFFFLDRNLSFAQWPPPCLACECVLMCERNVWGQASTMFNCPFTELSRVWSPSGQTAQHSDLLVRLHFWSSNNIILLLWPTTAKKKNRNTSLFLCAIFENKANRKGAANREVEVVEACNNLWNLLNTFQRKWGVWWLTKLTI